MPMWTKLRLMYIRYVRIASVLLFFLFFALAEFAAFGYVTMFPEQKEAAYIGTWIFFAFAFIFMIIVALRMGKKGKK